MEKSEFERLLQDKTEELNRVIESFLPEEKGSQRTVLEAMNYSVRAGGKRLRPMLLWETFLLCGGRKEDRRLIEPFLAAVEMIHTYSLVHDDLPAMDNDEYRRGKRTTWSVYGEAVGILAGDGLLNYAFETALKAFPLCGEDSDAAGRVARSLAVLARKAGVYGMIGGQTVDLETEGKNGPLEGEQLLFIHAHKTAALIQAPMMIGAILAGASEERIQDAEKCGYHIGIAFQIQDDILDVVGNSEELGKPVGSDAQNRKLTYVTWKGLEQAGADVENLSREALELLEELGAENGFLKRLTEELIHRRK
ncbi:MAG: polyprenyl synthetase family protein [Roseburia sp.]|nr:polyprenyl synthetase family protein [Roseburia sp.]MCM1098314.1 polyprenyl synthetase family protein [Ruminococcus flavefaciens]